MREPQRPAGGGGGQACSRPGSRSGRRGSAGRRRGGRRSSPAALRPGRSTRRGRTRRGRPPRGGPRSSGSSPSWAKKTTEPGHFAAIAAVSGSSALRTAGPAGLTTSTIVRFTFASVSTVVDVVEAEVVPLADVGDDRHVAEVERQAGAEDAAPGRLQHGRLDRRVHQDRRCALAGPAAIARLDPPLVDVDPVGAGHADGLAGRPQEVGDEPGDGRLAVGAR